MPQNTRLAAELYHRAAKQGKAEAQNNLGMMHHKGEGVEQDDGKAVSWYLKAAEQGLAEAQYNLGIMYKSGEGVRIDLVQACKWLNLAVLGGNENAQNDIKSLEDKMKREEIEQGLAMAREWLARRR